MRAALSRWPGVGYMSLAALALACSLVWPSPAASARATAVLTRLDLGQIARDQWGPDARLVRVGDTLYGWRARVNGKLHHLELSSATNSELGSGRALVAIGTGAKDWRVLNLAALQHVTLPIMLVASDQVSHPKRVAEARHRFRSVLGVVDAWYGKRAGVAPSFAPALALPTKVTSKKWAHLSKISVEASHRYDLYYKELDAFHAWLPDPNANWRGVLAPFAGVRPGLWLGAADGGPVAIGTPRETSVLCHAGQPLTDVCSDAAYAFGHELGHAYGLAHSCDVYPQYSDCGNSIMQTGKPMAAILLPPEIGAVEASPFLTECGTCSPSGGSALAPGQRLTASQHLDAANGQYSLQMQTDGNLVLYNAGHVPLWNSGTYNHPGAFAVMQNDGNLVVYLGSAALWNSHTNNHAGAFLTLDDGGHVGVYSPNGSALWKRP
jgi:hypothetical protein